MYHNIGGKIKVLARIVCAIGIIAALLTAVGLWINNSSFHPTMAAGLTILLAGSVATYVTSLFIRNHKAGKQEIRRNGPNYAGKNAGEKKDREG